MKDHDIITITPDNVKQHDLFCKKSKHRETPYQNKVRWFHTEYDLGLRIKLLGVDEGKKNLVSRGFIEYTPAEHGWRVVNAENYMLIHCLWVVGKQKNKGYGSELLQACIQDAKEQNMHGVIVVASKGNWLPDTTIFEQHGFVKVDEAPGGFELLANQWIDTTAKPSFPTNWNERSQAFGQGLSIIQTPQCPYILDATAIYQETADAMGIPHQIVELKTPKEVQQKAPSPYGVYNLVYNGTWISYCWASKKDAQKILEFCN